MGEPAGIGGELTLSAWLQRRRHRLSPFVAIDDPARLAKLAAQLGWTVPIEPVASIDEAYEVFDTGLPVLALREPVTAIPGRPQPASAAAVLASIETAVALAAVGKAAAVVTNPIQKSVLLEAGFEHPGHTEFLGALAGPDATPVMMLACPGLRVVPVTVHVALREALDRLRTERIVGVSRIAAAALIRDFGIDRPRLAVAGLNPHAGESGAFGDEEIRIIAPAVAQLREAGIEVAGPLPPDTMFHEAARRGYDAAICMYHDQALIPIKTIDFERGVNITLGLPFVRTSPDHGTALDIAGTGTANPASLLAALSTAEAMSRARHRTRA